MLAVNVQESTTTTGTGDITLAGSSDDGRTFTSQYQVGEKITTYYIDDLAGNFEKGSGYLSDATTLVREFVKESSNGGALVNFSSGTKQVFIEGDGVEQEYPPAIMSAGTNIFGRYIISAHWAISQTGSHVNATNLLYLTPYINNSTVAFTKWAARVKTAAVGGIMRMGIYQVNPATGAATGLPFMESDDIDCSSTTNSIDLSFINNVVNAVASKKLPKYFFLAIAFNDSAIRVQAQSAGNPLWLLGGNNATLTGISSSFTMGTPTPSVAVLPDLTSATQSRQYSLLPIGGFNDD